ncbi:MAG: DUF86 domain-containing protein [Chlorobiales bacterium]|nr:DUF86 domain-containing protein [Chlorobiales bacterium]
MSVLRLFSPTQRFNKYWSGVKGIRDVLSHQYFNIDAEEIFRICSRDLPDLHLAVKDMIKNIDSF